MTLGSLSQSPANDYYQVSTAGPLHYPTPETGGPVLGRNTVWDKCVDKTRHDEQIPDSRRTGAEISCSSASTPFARPNSCKGHMAVPACCREARRPGRRQLTRHALQPKNLSTTAAFSPKSWRNTQGLTEPRQPRFP